MTDDVQGKELQAIREAFDRVSAQGWGLALGLLAGLGLFLATAILVVQGGPNPGPHLSLLGVYFPGYAVTWAGALIGLGYGLIVGYFAGFVVGTVYNWIVSRFGS
jgi:hypothetical protein